MKRTILRMVAVVMMAVTMSANVALGVTAAEKKPKLSKNYVSVPVGFSFALKLRNKPKKSKITWRSNNKKIATVSKKGKIKGKKPGRTRVVCIVRKGKKKVRLVCSVHISKAGSKYNTPIPTLPPASATTIPSVVTSSPSQTANAGLETKVNTGKTVIALGTDLADLEKNVGKAKYTLKSEYEGCTWHVYNDDYEKLSIVHVKDNKVVGVYADSKGFNYEGIDTNTSYKDLEAAGYVTDDYKETYYKRVGDEVIIAYMDNIADKTVEGILVMERMTASINDRLSSTYEKISFEVTNAFRVKNGLKALVWNENVAKVARGHSNDMRDKQYFNHISPTGENPGDRLLKAGLAYSAYAENVAVGYINGFEVTYGWINSQGHRDSMLYEAVTNLGVGIESMCNYYTQLFYKGA